MEESFFDVDTSTATEPIAVDSGEYEIKIIGGEINTDKNGHPYFLPRFEVVNEPDAKDFTDFIRLPHDEISEKDLNRAKWKLETFKNCFGCVGSRVLLNELIGLTGWAILTVKEDPEYGTQNRIGKYIAPSS